MEGCLGCKTWLEEGSKLPLEDLLIELKNYSYPLKDQKHKWILLKTIVSFLNSKGGTIYIGVDDSSGEVRGIDINRKEQDEYKLFIQRLAEKIQPTVDLTNREDMKMHFLPVLKQGSFTGRFVAKIIVNQGELSKLYCFTQRVVLQNPNDKKYDDFDVVYSYKRINMGSVKEFSGYEAVAEAAYRAVNPPKLANTFHEGCNPDPKDTFSTGEQSPVQKELQTPTVPLSTYEQEAEEGLLIHFTSLKDRESRLKLEDILNKIMDKLQIIQYNISFEDQNYALIAEFALQSEWTHAIDYIDVNIDEINQEMAGKARFGKKGHEDDYAIYENERPELGEKEESGEVNDVGSNDLKINEEPGLIHKPESLEEEINEKHNNSEKDKKEDSISIVKKSKNEVCGQEEKYISLPSTIDISKSEILTITHLNTSKREELIEFINKIDNCKKDIKLYEKTIEIIFDNQSDFVKIDQKLQESKDIAIFGFQGILRFGINTGQITLTNYNKTKYREFKEYITKIVGEDVKRCEFTKNDKKFTLVLTLKSPEKAAIWLDKLVQDKEIKQFRIPKPRVDQKMKIDLVCVKPNPQISS